MAERRDILWRFLGDSKDLQKAAKGANKELGKTQKASKSLTGGMDNLKSAFVAAGGAFAIKEVGQFLFDSAKMAEQAGIVAGSFEKIFKESAPLLRESLEDVRLQVGLNSLEFEQLLLKTGQLLVGFGSTGDEAAIFGDKLFTVAADLAAFQGDVGLTDEALHALNRALVGEFDPLEQFVGGVKASTVAAKALEMGLADTTAELTDQDKALALLEIVADNAAAAMGSLSEQEETLASRTLEANARLDDLQIQLGQAVTPAILKATEGTLAFAEGLTFLADGSISTSSRLGELGQAFGQIWVWAAKLQIALSPLALLIKGIGKAAEAAGTQIGKMLKAIKDLGRNPISGINIPDIIPDLPSIPLPFNHSGGVVPGARGTSTPIMAQGGERITPLGGASGGASITINIGVAGDPLQTAQVIADLLTEYEQFNGTRISGVS